MTREMGSVASTEATDAADPDEACTVQELASDGKRPGNFIYSPLAIGLGLGMIYLGARGASREQMHEALNLSEVQEAHLLPAFAAMHWDLMRSSTPKGCQIEMAVRLFIPTQRSLTAEFEALFDDFEISRVRKANFENGDPKVECDNINRWVEDRTRGTVKDALPEDLIDKNCKALLVTAVYLRVQWKHQFDPRKTERCKFSLPGKDTVEVDMMNQRNLLRIGSLSKLNTECLELPFSNTHMKMFILLPHKGDGVTKLEARLTKLLLETITDYMTEQIVRVQLPRFRYETGFNPSECLQRQGMAAVFTSREADLSGIDGSRDLHVSNVFQHICVQVDEVGGEHVPVTSVHDDRGCAQAYQGKERSFKADRPFVFFIRDDRTGAIIVLGRVARPTF